MKIDKLVSIPLESGHIVIENILWRITSLGFNPLRIGSYCNHARFEGRRVLAKCFNPLRIGSYCNKMAKATREQIESYVSIPLESGHIVILKIFFSYAYVYRCFNPLRIGSYCNQLKNLWRNMVYHSFNPLRIGSYCNAMFMFVFKDVASGFNPLRIGSYCNLALDAKKLKSYWFQSP